MKLDEEARASYRRKREKEVKMRQFLDDLVSQEAQVRKFKKATTARQKITFDHNGKLLSIKRLN